MPWNVPVTPHELLEQFHRQVRLADRDAAPGYVVDRDGPVHRTYPPDAAEHGAMVECPEGLGDDPDQPRYIRTERGLGYRFLTDDAR